MLSTLDGSPLSQAYTCSQAKAPSDARILKIRDYEDKLVTIQASVKVRLRSPTGTLAGH